MTPSDTCEAYEEQLGAYIAGLLDTDVAEQVRRHTETCERCGPALAETRTLAGVVRAIPVPAPALAFDESLAALLSRVTPRENARTSPPSTTVGTLEVAPLSGRPARENTGTRSNSRGRHLRSLGAIAAALALIVAAVAIFSSFAGSHRAARPTVSPAATKVSAPPGQWETVARLSDLGGRITVAPSDPRVLYRVQDGLKFSRSSDEGKTWSTRTLPTDLLAATDTLAYASIGVDPGNPNILYLMLTPGPNNPNCPPTAIGPKIGRSGNPLCRFQYVSTDSGATWKQPVLPQSGTLGNVVAQDNTRYAILYVGTIGSPASGRRLISSADGVTWAFADAPIATQSAEVVEFIATPTGSTLFAKAAPAWTIGTDTQDPLHTDLWRSEDAGRTWTDLGLFPDATLAHVTNTDLAAASQQNGQIIVYRYTSVEGTNNTTGGETLYVSVDGGVTWQTITSAGVPSDMLLQLPISGGTLANGSLAVAFAVWSGVETQPMRMAYFGWRPGAASWTRLTPDLTLYYDVPGWIAPAHNGDPATVWLQVITGFTQTSPNTYQGNAEDMLRCVLG